MSKEHSIMKGFYHLAIAGEYLKDVVRSESYTTKQIFNNYTNRIAWILKDASSRLSPESKAVFDAELNKGDVLFFEAIAEKCAHLTAEQRDVIETLIDAVIKGETIEFETKTNVYE